MRLKLLIFLIFSLFFANSESFAQDILIKELYGKVEKKQTSDLYTISSSDGKKYVIDFSYCSLRSSKRLPEIGQEIGLLYLLSTNEKLSQNIQQLDFMITWFFRRQIRSAKWIKPSEYYDGVAIAMYQSIEETFAFSAIDPYGIDNSSKIRNKKDINLLGLAFLNALKLGDEAKFRELHLPNKVNPRVEKENANALSMKWHEKDLSDIRSASLKHFQWNEITNVKIECNHDYSDEVNLDIIFNTDDGKKKWMITTGAVTELNDKLYFKNRCRIPLMLVTAEITNKVPDK